MGKNDVAEILVPLGPISEGGWVGSVRVLRTFLSLHAIRAFVFCFSCGRHESAVYWVGIIEVYRIEHGVHEPNEFTGSHSMNKLTKSIQPTTLNIFLHNNTRTPSSLLYMVPQTTVKFHRLSYIVQHATKEK